MKIGLVVPHFYPAYGGHEYYLSRELAHLGHQVGVFTSDFMPVRYFRRPTRTFPGKELTGDGVEVTRIRAAIDVQGLPVFDPRGALAGFGPRVVQGTEFYHPSSYLSFVASAKKGVPFVFAQHMYEVPKGAKGLAWKGLSFTLGSQMRRGSSRIIAISNAAKSLLVSLGVPEERIAVIPLGVDTSFFRTADAGPGLREQLGLEDSTVVLFVGRMEDVKGVDVLLEAFSLLRKNDDSLCLVLVGGGAQKPRYEALASHLGITSGVRFVGSVTREALPSYLDVADIFVLPSLKEPFGLVGLEAMAKGKPVVASAVGGIPDFVGAETGLLVRPGSARGLASALERLAADPSLRARLGEGGRKLVDERFSYRHVAERTVEVFEEAGAGAR